MSLRKRIVIGIAAYLALLLTLFVFVHGFPVHVRGDRQAFMEWMRNPNPQTESALHAQARKHEIILLRDSAIAALVLWLCGFASYEVIRRLARRLRDSDRQTGTRITSK